MKLRILLYGIVLALMIAGLKILEYKLVIMDHDVELYGGIVALIFTAVGIFAGNKLLNPKKPSVEPKVQDRQIGNDQITGIENDFGLSKREVEILELLAQGMSNQEISDQTFISVNTVKTHISNLYSKLEVNRRTQAVVKARSHKIIL